ncbi:potassium voltage-gated channel subfamily H member 6-like isoform X2 [Paramacrobiotus metropolitanus]|uniref:potassium voltage-gated channel subfamily H member 6-like isoform X2 n=1 Tax=Paramacrobiotus metropolitanus TaxID=2943436 RepID=UPI00244649B3|nr:potassium voltage-gated channel subfamily H member 6-like isoform X2 [Paramacrobiotus metropolitanus]
MPVRRGHVAPKNTFIETIIRKFESQNRVFLICNATIPLPRIIYSSDRFNELSGFSRSEVMQNNCTIKFLHGPKTDLHKIQEIEIGVQQAEELQVELWLYKKDGTEFLCNVILAPVRNETSSVIMYILNFEDLTDKEDEERHNHVRPQLNLQLPRFRRTGSRRSKAGSPSPSDFGGNYSIASSGDVPVSITSTQRGAPASAAGAAATAGEAIPMDTFSATFNPNMLSVSAQQFPPGSRRASTTPSVRSIREPSGSRATSSAAERQENYASSRENTQSPVMPHSFSGMSIGAATSASGPGAASATTAPSTGRGHDVPRMVSVDATSLHSAERLHINRIPPHSSHIPKISPTSSLADLKATYGSSEGPGPASSVDQPRHEMKKSDSLGHKVHGIASAFQLEDDKTQDFVLNPPKVNRWTILHYSPFKAVWDWIILLLVIYTAIVTPYVAAFLLNEEERRAKLNQNPETRGEGAEDSSNRYDDPMTIVDLIVDIMFIVDILINFRTTYVNTNDEVVSDLGKISVHYFKGWFLIDVVAAIPFDLLLFGSQSDETTTLIGLLKTARLLRLVRVARKLDRYSEYGAAVLMLLLATFLLIAHWLSCIWYAIGNVEKAYVMQYGWLDQLAQQTKQYYNETDITSGPSLKSKYITSLYFIMSSLTTIGFGNISATTNSEKIFSICVMMVGSLMYASIFGNVSAIIQRLYSGTARYHTQLAQVKEFIRFHQIPNPLRQRLEEYFQHAWSYTNGINMNEVLKGFPECLQGDICLHLNRQLLENNPAFRDASPGCLRALSVRFHTTHVPPGDTLVHRGDVLNALYFVSRGSLEVIKEDIVEAILGKDDVFGENPCIYPTIGKSSATVRALSYCDLHKIWRDDILDILESYPEFHDHLSKNLELTVCLRDEELSAQVSQIRLPRGQRHESSSDENEDELAKEPSRRRTRQMRPQHRGQSTSHPHPDRGHGDLHGHRSSSISPESHLYSLRPEGAGKGILEFTPFLAGQDVTPANLDFDRASRRSTLGDMVTAIKRSITDLALSKPQPSSDTTEQVPLLHSAQTSGIPHTSREQRISVASESPRTSKRRAPPLATFRSRASVEEAGTALSHAHAADPRIDELITRLDRFEEHTARRFEELKQILMARSHTEVAAQTAAPLAKSDTLSSLTTAEFYRYSSRSTTAGSSTSSRASSDTPTNEGSRV